MLPFDGLVMPDDGVMPGVAVAGAVVDGFIALEGLVAPCASARPDVAKAIVLTTAAAVKNRFIISSNQSDANSRLLSGNGVGAPWFREKPRRKSR
jgi:hypothetical protein